MANWKPGDQSFYLASGALVTILLMILYEKKKMLFKKFVCMYVTVILCFNFTIASAFLKKYKACPQLETFLLLKLTNCRKSAHLPKIHFWPSETLPG